jgi:predicted Zn-dependent protease
MNRFFFIACLTGTLLSLSNCARNPVTGKSQVVLMSEAQEIQMGKEADPQVVQQFGLYEDPALQNYINEKGHEIVKVSHRPNIDYTYRIINSEVVNAFAIPGGYVYFTRAIMAYFNNEAEFAGVLGHETGHIAARHTVSQQRNQVLSQIGVIAGMVLVPGLAQFGEAASQGVGLLLLKNGRDAERQADQLGVEYSEKIGYDAQNMANFFKTLQRQEKLSGQEELPAFLSTHPDPGDRYTTVTKLATEWRQKLNASNLKTNRNEYLRRIEGLIYGEDPKEGYLENNVFYHPPLKLQFNTPLNWSYQNSPSQVQFASKDGKALLVFKQVQGTNLQDAANQFIQQYKIEVARSGATTINGLNAYVIEGDIPQQQNALRTATYFIQYNGAIYQFIGVSTTTDFGNYVNVMVNSIQSFRSLADQSHLNKKPERIRIKTVYQSPTLESALTGFGTPQKRLQELAILNGMQLTDRIPAGTLIKTIGQ